MQFCTRELWKGGAHVTSRHHGARVRRGHPRRPVARMEDLLGDDQIWHRHFRPPFWRTVSARLGDLLEARHPVIPPAPSATLKK